jgi:hypothetical protein
MAAQSAGLAKSGSKSAIGVETIIAANPDCESDPEQLHKAAIFR